MDLLNICANACVRSMTLGFYMAQHTALRICKLYKDPQTLWVSNGNASVISLIQWNDMVCHARLAAADMLGMAFAACFTDNPPFKG